jgi:hypothetical protein
VAETVPLSACPTCRVVMGFATHLEDDNDKKPKPGDVSVCMVCGEILSFAEDMSLEICTAEEREALELGQRAVLVETQRRVRERNRGARLVVVTCG